MAIGRMSVPVRHGRKKALDRLQSLGINQINSFVGLWWDWDLSTGILEMKTPSAGIYNTWLTMDSAGAVTLDGPYLAMPDIDASILLGHQSNRTDLILSADQNGSSEQAIIGSGLDPDNPWISNDQTADGMAGLFFDTANTDGKMYLGVKPSGLSAGTSLTTTPHTQIAMSSYSLNDGIFFTLDSTANAVIFTPTAMRLSSGIDFYMNADSNAIALGQGSDFTMTFNGTNTIMNMVAGDWLVQDGGTEIGRWQAGGLKITGQGYSAMNTLTDAATVDWDMNDGQTAEVTLAGNRTFAAPTNLKDGSHFTLVITQDGTGSRTGTFNSAFKFPGGTAPTLSTAAGAKDILNGVTDGTNLYCVLLNDFS